MALLLGQQVKKVLLHIESLTEPQECKIKNAPLDLTEQKILPAPVIPEGKEIPEAIYTSKNFNIAASVRTMNPLIQKNPKSEGVEKFVEEHVVSINDDEEHLPAG